MKCHKYSAEKLVYTMHNFCRKENSGTWAIEKYFKLQFPWLSDTNKSESLSNWNFIKVAKWKTNHYIEL